MTPLEKIEKRYRAGKCLPRDMGHLIGFLDVAEAEVTRYRIENERLKAEAFRLRAEVERLTTSGGEE